MKLDPKDTATLAVGGVLVLAAWYWWQQQQDDDSSDGSDVFGTAAGALNDGTQSIAQMFDSWTGGALRLSEMSNVTAADVANPNVQAFLRVIRAGEGTAGADGYNKLFGGSLFSSFADHPRKSIKASGYTSTAAGAYQFLVGVWDETRRIMGLTDFSPRSQDMAAVGRIAARGALADVENGNFATAVSKCAREWASLPGSPYGQPTISIARASAIYTANGGALA